jgi:uncharacterized membrane protein
MLIELLLAKEKKCKKPTHIGEERISRSIVKAISWRLIGTLDTIIIAYFITNTFQQALTIGFIEWVSKMILYFIHERVWNQILWGKKQLL